MAPSPPSDAIIVAGHVCLDIIPALPRDESGLRFRPGALVATGSATVATGGCVSNTGTALRRLGVTARLLGKVGDDPFGRLVRDLLAGDGATDAGLLVSPGEQTSYSVILSPPGHDRMILHFPGANDTFASDDIPDGALMGARLFHFGYPPAMERMFADGGAELVRLLRRAKEAGLTTSLDMSYPDPASPAGQADWIQILRSALPHVDVFQPSLEEAVMMVHPVAGAGTAPRRQLAGTVSFLGELFTDMGAAIAAIKLGERGLYLRTAAKERLRRAGPGLPRGTVAWAARELWSNVFDTTVVGTTGAGDATVAGFLFGLHAGMSPEETIAAACSVGASSVEAADATSAIVPWRCVEARLNGGWARRRGQPGEGWRAGKQEGLWHGPADGLPRAAERREGHR